MSTALALIDCRNFYVSVERAWNVAIREKPVLVLSNNDGAVVALSEEVKKLGIRRGTPFFEIRDLVEQHQIVWFSSNYTLYGDYSARVREVLTGFVPSPSLHIEQYSIDEWFIDLSHVPADALADYGYEIRATILQHLNLPVSVGIAKTKTLTKIGCEVARHYPEYTGVVNLAGASEQELDGVLAGISVGDVWMVGPRYAAALNQQYGIYTAKQLREADLARIRKWLTVVGARTVLELRGIPCIPLEPREKPKKTIASAKSFGRPIERLEELEEAVATYTAHVAGRLRSQQSVAGSLSVFITTSRFNPHVPQYANAASQTLRYPTAFTPELIDVALHLLRPIYRAGFSYVKAGVFLAGIRPGGHLQLDLFGEAELVTHGRKARLMELVDEQNRVWGRDTIFFGSMGTSRSWQMKRERLSPRYTSRWQEVLEVHADF